MGLNLLTWYLFSICPIYSFFAFFLFSYLILDAVGIIFYDFILFPLLAFSSMFLFYFLMVSLGFKTCIFNLS